MKQASSKPQAEKLAVKTEIKEKALDLAKAGVKQILAALKDLDIKASATPGEVSCKSDATQNGARGLCRYDVADRLVLSKDGKNHLFSVQKSDSSVLELSKDGVELILAK